MATKAPQWVESLGRLVGTWTTEASHPAMPGVVVSGSVTVEWLEGARFYEPTNQGLEQAIGERLARLRGALGPSKG